MAKRNKFGLSHFHLLSAKMGQLFPVMCQETLPGDTFQGSTSALIRLSPLNTPVMHPVFVRLHTFFVPSRILWKNWENFITGGPDGADTSEYPVINVPANGFGKHTLADYFGLNVNGPATGQELDVSALPFRAYQLIWNHYYRDQDLQAELSMNLEDGVDTTTNTDILNVCWEKDYFTTARPWTQKGPEVYLPLGVSAPVSGSLTQSTISGTGFPSFYGQIGPSGVSGTMYNNNGNVAYNAGTAVQNQTLTWGNPNLSVSSSAVTGTADLSQASAVTINDIRLASGLQRYEENRARFGSRYPEYLMHEFGVRPADARIQWPEYIGGGKQIIQFSEVLQTAPDAGTGKGVGDLYGHGITAIKAHRFRYFCQEHGYIITLMAVQPKTVYQQGNFRMWNRRTKEDYFQPELQTIGQQEILNKELYSEHDDPNGIFGYQDRYDEYRRSESIVSGDFRDILNTWHMARKFETAPALNSDFVTSNPTSRIFQDQVEDTLWIMAHNQIRSRRCILKQAINVLK